jgi:acyl carrier protein
MSPGPEQHRARVARVISQVMGVPVGEVGDQASPRTLKAWDSMGHMNLMLALEEEFGVRFSDDRILQLLSVPAILAELDLVLPAGGSHA